jgi:hypothetical protein
MSFEQKYLKYKSKYLALKAQTTNLQKGGAKNKSKSFYGNDILDLENLSVTPTMMEAYGYNFNLVGGLNDKKFKDADKLSKLLSESEDINTTELSQSAGSDNESELNALTETPTSETEEKKDKSNQTTESESEPESTKSESEPEQYGGKEKTKSNKKYFFDDSEFELNSTTSDSNLTSLDSDTTDSSDANL